MKKKIKLDVINTLLFARRDWDRLLDGIDEMQMMRSGACGDWSIKDLIAHVSWYEGEMEELFRTGKLEGSQLWELDADQRNDVIFRENQFRSLDELKQRSLRGFARLLTALENANPQAFVDAGAIEGMPADWQPLELLAENTWSHYAIHAEHIKEFLKS